MRELKFRVWEGKDMRLIDWNNDNLHIGRINVAILSDAIREKPEHVMQFTGLKDKNGKEIYEGDIIKWGDHLYEIVWDQEYAQFNHRAITCDMDDYFECDNSKSQEVIGNKFETPELLE